MKTVQIHEIENLQQDFESIANLTLKGYRLHHTATRHGYVSRKTRGYITAYEGRFGKGYEWHIPRYDTTQYHYVEYWIKEDEQV